MEANEAAPIEFPPHGEGPDSDEDSDSGQTRVKICLAAALEEMVKCVGITRDMAGHLGIEEKSLTDADAIVEQAWSQREAELQETSPLKLVAWLEKRSAALRLLCEASDVMMSGQH